MDFDERTKARGTGDIHLHHHTHMDIVYFPVYVEEAPLLLRDYKGLKNVTRLGVDHEDVTVWEIACSPPRRGFGSSKRRLQSGYIPSVIGGILSCI